MKKTNINKRIPGILPPPPKTEIDGHIADLSSKSIPELIELRDRQLKLLNNKLFISKLSDKGMKIQTFYEKILSELQAKEEVERTCDIFDKLNLNAINKNSLQNIEWEGKVDPNRKDPYLDSDDDSEPENLIHILSQSTATEKKVEIVKPEKPLVTPEDLLNIGELPHVKYIINKTEIITKPKTTGQFKPFKTTISDVHNPEKEIHRKKHKYWEVTAATPPPIIHGPTKLLSIEESLNLQKEHNSHLKEIQAQHAAERLLQRTGITMSELPKDTTILGKYRDVNSDNSDESDAEGSDKEVHDEEPERGGVIFTVMK